MDPETIQKDIQTASKHQELGEWFQAIDVLKSLSNAIDGTEWLEGVICAELAHIYILAGMYHQAHQLTYDYIQKIQSATYSLPDDNHHLLHPLIEVQCLFSATHGKNPASFIQAWKTCLAAVESESAPNACRQYVCAASFQVTSCLQ